MIGSCRTPKALDETIKALTRALKVLSHAKEIQKLETAKQSEILIGKIIHDENLKLDTERSMMTERDLERRTKRQRSEERDQREEEKSTIGGASSIVSGLISSVTSGFRGTR